MDDEGVWSLFKPFIQRFCDTWRKFPPGCDCDLIAVVNNSDATNELHEIFDGLPVHFIRYDGKGADVASWQLASKLNPGRFMVASTSRAYFHREYWLRRMVEARERFGPGLYSTGISSEGGLCHLCIRFIGIDTDIFNLYPHQIDSRDKGCFFEIGQGNPDGCFSDWAQNHGQAVVVYWSGEFDGKVYPRIPNCFRNGDQSECLVFDRHTDEYRDATPEGKAWLEKQCFQGECGPRPETMKPNYELGK
jgi:hypothetical protein